MMNDDIEYSNIIELICSLDNKIKSLSKSTKRIPEQQVFYDLLRNSYYINIYDYDIHNIMSCDEFEMKLALLTKGACMLFDNCIMYGKFIYDMLMGQTNGYVEIYIAPMYANSNIYFDKYMKLSMESDKYYTYTYENIKININKRVYTHISELMCECDCTNNICFDGENIIAHPLFFLKILLHDTYDIINYNNGMNGIMKYLNPIVYDDYDTFVTLVNDKRVNDTEKIFNTCIYFEKYNYIEYMIKNDMIPNATTIFKAIKYNKFQYIKLLMEQQIDIDVLNNDGFSPIEYAMNMYTNEMHAGNDVLYIQQIIVLLNKQKYSRNPKWWDLINSIKIYNSEPMCKFDKCMSEKLKNVRGISIRNLNDVIINTMIDNNMVAELLHYITKHFQFINIDNMLKYIQCTNNLNILNYIEHYIPVSNELIKLYFNMQLYDKLVNIIPDIDVEYILFYLVEIFDVKGLVFMFEYIDKLSPKRIFQNGNTILHLLCKNSNNPESMTPELSHTVLLCLKIILNYNPELVNIKNDDGDTPIFLSNKNNYMNELLIMSDSDLYNINNIGDTYLHNIVRNGSIDVLNKALLCGVVQRNELMDKRNNNNETALILACKMKKQDHCNILINYGANTELCDNFGNSLYHYIALYGLSLIKIDTIRENKNFMGYSPREYIVQNVCNELDSV